MLLPNDLDDFSYEALCCFCYDDPNLTPLYKQLTNDSSQNQLLQKIKHHIPQTKINSDTPIQSTHDGELMRVSTYYSLNRTQPSLDFVDVDIYGDSRVFVDPRALRLLKTEWAEECVALIQHFFGVVIAAIQGNRHCEARNLLSALREPNETHLGLSKGKARGRALGTESAKKVWESLLESEAASSGLLEDLEDTILMIPGISSDIVSDISTNIIREPLIRYTQGICTRYGIPLQDGVDSGPLWDPSTAEWYNEFTSLPMTSVGKLLLVPKVIVRKKMDYNDDEYFRYYVLEYLRDMELSANSELVQLLKDGTPRVTKKDLIKKYGAGKTMIVDETRKHPEILEQYRNVKERDIAPPLTHTEIAEGDPDALPDWDALLSAVTNLPSGRENASEYENVVEQFLSALFYPSLTNPKVQREINQGRKRVAITYSNVAVQGFFAWVGQHYSAPFIFIECENYSVDPTNSELDQLAGRFSQKRGRFGLLICRKLNDRDLVMERCRDTANDGRGFILALDDNDLIQLVDERKLPFNAPKFQMLQTRFEELVM